MLVSFMQVAGLAYTLKMEAVRFSVFGDLPDCTASHTRK
jgi:hypothetical protein